MQGNKGNRTGARGKGYRSRLSKAEQDALSALFEAHGYEAVNVEGLQLKPVVVGSLALISGELATVLLGDDERWYAIDKLLHSGDEVLESIGRQLENAAKRESNATQE